MSPSAKFYAFASLSVYCLVPSEGGLAPNYAGVELLVRGLGVVEFTAETLRDRVLRREVASGLNMESSDTRRDASSWLVLFCKADDANCAQLAPSFEQLCLRMAGPSGDVRFGTLDCSLSEDTEALCADLGVEAYPTVAHYKKGKHVSSWTSEKKVGLFPWLHKELQGTNSQSGELSRSVAMAKSAAAAQAKQVKQADDVDRSLNAPVTGISHLKYLHEFVLMEDCVFSRLLSGVLMALTLGKCGWILVTGAELWPFGSDASSSYSDVSILY